jgi:hypothetical protein
LSRWYVLATLAAVGTFVAGVVLCAFRGWHAPRPEAIALLTVGAFAAGVVLAGRRFAESDDPFDYHERLSARVIHPAGPAVAALGSLLFATLATAAVVALLDEWTSLVLASLVGSAWVATLPLQPILARALAERRLEVGLDAVLVGSRRIWFRDVAAAEARGRLLSMRLREGSERLLLTARPEVATRFAELVAARAAPEELPAGLERAGRSLDAWRAELCAADYRTRRLDPEEAERVLRSGSATRDQRMAAALVLADAGQQGRVLALRSSFVDTSMRIALERIAEGSIRDSWIEWTERDG